MFKNITRWRVLCWWRINQMIQLCFFFVFLIEENFLRQISSNKLIKSLFVSHKGSLLDLTGAANILNMTGDSST